MSKWTARLASFWAAGLMCAVVLATSFTGTALAVADSRVTGTLAHSGRFAISYTSPGFGYQIGDGDDLWAECLGKLEHPGDVVYNSASAGWAKKTYIGLITGADEGAWRLQASCFLTATSTVNYEPAGWVYVENHRAEATAIVESRGSFGDQFDQSEAAVDNYTTPGFSRYDGVGCAGHVYPSAADCSVKSSAAPNRGEVKNSLTAGLILDQWHYGVLCYFFLYCQAHQYIYSNEEDDAAFDTMVRPSNPDNPTQGWHGILNSYEIIGGSYLRIRTHPIP